MSKNESEKTQHTSNIITELNKNDVLLGRGGRVNAWVGNVQFRDLVKRFRGMYFDVKKTDKAKVAENIVRIIHNMEPRGRFLKEAGDDSNPDSWVEIEDQKAIKKTGQAMREKEESKKEHSIPFADPTYMPLPAQPSIHPVAQMQYNHQPNQMFPGGMPSQQLAQANNSMYPPDFTNRGIDRTKSLSSVGVAPTSDKSSINEGQHGNMNSRRNLFRRMKGESSSLPSLCSGGLSSPTFTTPTNLPNAGALMKESLVSMEMQSTEQMQNLSTTLQDKISINGEFNMEMQSAEQMQNLSTTLQDKMSISEFNMESTSLDEMMKLDSCTKILLESQSSEEKDETQCAADLCFW